MGDYELLSDLLNIYPGLICPVPIDIEAQTVSGASASNVFQLYVVKCYAIVILSQEQKSWCGLHIKLLCVFWRYSATQGLACVNTAQAGGVCADYKVRFICPEAFCSSEWQLKNHLWNETFINNINNSVLKCISYEIKKLICIRL